MIRARVAVRSGRSATLVRGVAVAAVMLAAHSAHANDVRVVDAAGDLVYVSAGAADGLRAGMIVKFGDREAVVVATNAHTAALRGAVSVGATGTFAVAESHVPRPESAFAEQWPAPERPAAHQKVAAIATPARIDFQLVGSAYAIAGGTAQAEARMIASFDDVVELPLGADLDASARWYSTGANKLERTPLYVHAAQLRYGGADDPALVVGRLRYAASSLGMLDGGRAAVHVGSVELAAFGGLVPDPVSGKPTTDASRFGAEVVYATEAARVAATAYGSTWMGTLDERRLSVVASTNHNAARVDGWFDAQVFPSGNPWGASTVEITGAGASASWRKGTEHLGVDVTFLRPDRSLRLAAALPDEWLCASSPADDMCHGGDWWLATTLSGGTRVGPWSLDAVASLGTTHNATHSVDASGYLRADRDFGIWRAIVSASAGRAYFATFEALELGIGVSPSRRIDASLSYRPERFAEEAAASRIIHEGVAEVRATLSRQIAVALSALGSADALAVLATVVWHPRAR